MSKSSIITDDEDRNVNPHPGETLREDFLVPLGMDVEELAASIHHPVRDLRQIIEETDRVTSDLDLRLARYFGLSEGFFLRLQIEYDLMESRRRLSKDLVTIRPHAA